MGRNNVLADSLSGPNTDPGLRVDSEVGGVSGPPQEVAGDDRPVCHLIESPLYTLFLALPQSECSGDGRASSELGWSSGVRLPTLGPDSSRSQEAPFILRCSHDSGGLVLASARPWFPDLLELVVDGPVVLPLCPDPLRQPHSHRHHLGIHRLSRRTWRLSSALPGLKASLL